MAEAATPTAVGEVIIAEDGDRFIDRRDVKRVDEWGDASEGDRVASSRQSIKFGRSPFPPAIIHSASKARGLNNTVGIQYSTVPTDCNQMLKSRLGGRQQMPNLEKDHSSNCDRGG